MTAGWRSEARARCVAARKYGERGEPVTLSTTYDALRALDALDAVLALHAPIEVFSPYAQPPGMVTVCSGCGDWPCPTVRAIEGET